MEFPISHVKVIKPREACIVCGNPAPDTGTWKHSCIEVMSRRAERGNLDSKNVPVVRSEEVK